jgi:hypothetical protein
MGNIVSVVGKNEFYAVSFPNKQTYFVPPEELTLTRDIVNDITDEGDINTQVGKKKKKKKKGKKSDLLLDDSDDDTGATATATATTGIATSSAGAGAGAGAKVSSSSLVDGTATATTTTATATTATAATAAATATAAYGASEWVDETLALISSTPMSPLSKWKDKDTARPAVHYMLHAFPDTHRELNLSLVTTLLCKGCDVGATDCDENSLLHIAAMRNDIALVELLIQHNAPAQLLNASNKLAEQLTTNDTLCELLTAERKRQKKKKKRAKKMKKRDKSN